MTFKVKGKAPPTPAGTSLRTELATRFSHLRMHSFKRPVDRAGKDVELGMPDDLTAINDTQLGMLLTRAIRLVSWAKGVATFHDVEYLEAKRRVDVAKARAFLGATGPREERAARVLLDPEVERLQQALLVAEAMKRMTEAVYQGYEDSRGGISREITRRQAATEHRGMNGDAPSRGRLR